MSRAIVVTCAVTGSADSVGKHPAIPVTPKEIAESAIGAAKAGAAVVHIHVRDPQTGRASGEFKLYQEVVDRIRQSDVDVIINLTSGYGGRLLIDRKDPKRILPESPFLLPEDRVTHICELKPEICSLDMGSMNFGSAPFINLPDHLQTMAELIQKAGVCPELEVFEAGHIRLSRHFIDKGIIKPPYIFQLCLGIQWSMPATEDALQFMRRHLPQDAPWSAFGISSSQYPMVEAAVKLGGNVRVGLEDNLYMEKGVFAPDNAALVAKAVKIIENMGHRAASAQEARQLLGLNKGTRAANTYEIRAG